MGRAEQKALVVASHGDGHPPGQTRPRAGSSVVDLARDSGSREIPELSWRHRSRSAARIAIPLETRWVPHSWSFYETNIITNIIMATAMTWASPTRRRDMANTPVPAAIKERLAPRLKLLGRADIGR
jgi:hypothetical protein